MLKVDNLTLNHKKDLTDLVAGLSFTLRDGERMALIGEEGNGKSTLLKCIAGDPSVDAYIAVSGSILLTDAPGYLPQELPERERALSAYEFFCESPAFFDQSPRDLGALSARLSLPSDVFYSEQAMSAFSGGERVKLQLARLLMGRPGVLLLDEPTNDLDHQAVRWLEGFLRTCSLPVMFVSHDEMLLRETATSVLLIERLRRRQLPRAAVYRTGYEEFIRTRADGFAHQEQVARKEREEQRAKMERYNQIRQRVEHEQNTVSRQDPHGGQLLKKKMRAVMSMGRRFEREAQNMTEMPESEEAIFSKLACQPLPAGKVVLDLSLPQLTAGGRVLSENLRLQVRGQDKLLICGRNGAGKSTLLRVIRDALAHRADLRPFYMPQDPGDLLDLDKTPLEMLCTAGGREERIHSGVALGSMKFTAEEMNHSCRGLSGGQKAKLMFLMMAASGANVLLLDEPTRNLSPLSGPVVRSLFARYPGCIIAVSHDAMFAREVCRSAVRLDEKGLQSCAPEEI